MLFVNVKSFFPYPNKYKRIYIEEIKIKTLELFFTLDNVVDNRIVYDKMLHLYQSSFFILYVSLYRNFNKYKFKNIVY